MGDLEQGQKARTRWVWGCTGGCLLLLVVAGLSIFLFVRHLLRPVPVVPPATFVGPQTSAFLFLRIEPDDELMVELPARLAVSPVFEQNVPARPGADVVEDIEQAREMIAGVAPVQMVTVLEPQAEDAPLRRGGVLSVHKLSRLFGIVARAAIEDASIAAPQDYRDALIGTTLDGAAMAMRGNNYMAADSEQMIKRWVEALAEERARGPEEAPPALDVDETLRRAYDRLDPSAPILFASLNAHHELGALLASLPEGEARRTLVRFFVAGPEVVTFSGQLIGLNNRDGELTLLFECVDAAVAGELRDRLRTMGEEFEAENPLEEMTVTLQEPEVVRLRGRVENLADKLAAAINYLAREHREAERARRQAAVPAVEPATPPSP